MRKKRDKREDGFDWWVKFNKKERGDTSSMSIQDFIPSTANNEFFIENLPKGASMKKLTGDTTTGMIVNHFFSTNKRLENLIMIKSDLTIVGRHVYNDDYLRRPALTIRCNGIHWFHSTFFSLSTTSSCKPAQMSNIGQIIEQNANQRTRTFLSLVFVSTHCFL